MNDDTFTRRGRSPYRIAAVAFALFVLAVAWDVAWFAPPWWAH